MKKAVLCGLLISSFALSSQAQILLSSVLSGGYSQNFDSLASTGTSGTWTDNTTLPGWYASKFPGGVVTAQSVYRVDAGANNSGSMFDYGSAGSSDRSLGSLSSGTPLNNSIGLLLKNDTGVAQTLNLTLAYTGEQWRQGGNLSIQTNLFFDYTISSVDISGAVLSSVTNNPAFINDPALSFISPVTGATSAALDGNAPANRTALSDTLNITLNAGDEVMFRWTDINDAGNDHGGSIDDLSLSVPEPTMAALGGFAALALILKRRNRR